MSAPTLPALYAVILSSTLLHLERQLGRAWTSFDTLPACPECGAPEARGRVAGVLCMGAGGRLRDPHKRRIAAWLKAVQP